MKKRLYEVARDLDLSSKDLMSLGLEMGFDWKSVQATLSDEEQRKVKKALTSDESDKPSKVKVPFAQGNKVVQKVKKRLGIGLKKSEKIRPEKYEVRKGKFKVSPRVGSMIAWAIFGGLIVMSVGSAMAYSGAKNMVKAEAGKLIVSQKPSQTSVVDYQKEAFLSRFVDAYFTYSGDPKVQSSQIMLLNSFYGGKAPLSLSQGQMKNACVLLSKDLMNLTASQATFLVSYSTLAKNYTTMFTFDFVTENHKYYVSSYPTFTDVPDVLVQNPELVPLSSTSLVSADIEKSLTAFVSTLFTAKSQNQNALDLVASGLTLSTGEKLKSVDYTYFVKQGSGYQAVVQVTMTNPLGSHTENYVFQIATVNKTYFASHFRTVITTEDVTPKTN